MACALLLRGRQETVTSAWTWITGYVFPNRYKDITPPVCFIGVDQSKGKYFYPVLCILHVGLIRLSNALPAGHLLCDQPPHRHSDGGKSGKGADGKHCLWDRTLYQEYRLQQGQRVSLLWSFSLRLLDLLTSNTELNHLHCLIS